MSGTPDHIVRDLKVRAAKRVRDAIDETVALLPDPSDVRAASKIAVHAALASAASCTAYTCIDAAIETPANAPSLLAAAHANPAAALAAILRALMRVAEGWAKDPTQFSDELGSLQ